MLLENWEKIERYYKAWWNCEVLDKVPIWVAAPRDDPQSREILSGDTIKIRKEERFNEEKVIGCAEKILRATFFGGIAFPSYWPNFGPDIFSAFMGADIEFSPVFSPTDAPLDPKRAVPVSWAKWNNPILKDYSDLSVIQIKEDNLYWQKTKEFMHYAIERSQGNYIVGLTNILAGIDALSVLRGSPERACLDLIENPEGVKKAIKLLGKIWYKVYEESYHIIAGKQKGNCSWTKLWFPEGGPVLDDLACLISTPMYREFLLEEMVDRINYLGYSLYHLDGPDALHHLDMLLEIPSLNAIQWVPGVDMWKKEGVARWIPIYGKIQAKKKAIQVFCEPDEVDFVIENLKPEGLLIYTMCSSEKEAKELLSDTGWI